VTSSRRCPSCDQAAPARPVSFTWWGGVVGPRLLSHVQCSACGARYNGQTGRPNTDAILIYSVVVAVIAVALIAMIVRS
jgi:hypothetical protein